MQQEDKELFKSYEIKNWNYSARLYKIFGIAAVFNLAMIFVMAQTEIFTTRGCDSPMVSRVCQVLDTVYLGSVLLGTDSNSVSIEYDRTTLEDADITYIDVSDVTPPLSYPAGYFALANPESQYMTAENPTDFSSVNPSGIPGIPGFPSNPTLGNTDLSAIPQVTPTPNKDAVVGTPPLTPFEFSDSNPIGANPVPNPTISRNKPPRNYPRKPKVRNTSPRELPDLSDETTAENKPPTNTADPVQPEPKSEPVKDIEINRKPFEDLGDSVNEGLAKNEVDLNKPFLVVMDGVITDDGKLDRKKSKFVQVEGDEKMREVARQAIEAVGDSGFLAYLKNSGVDKVNFKIVQDDKQINVIIVSEQKNPNTAKTTASSLNSLLSVAKLADTNGLKKLDENSKTLIENSKITAEGKNFVLNFALPKQTAQDIITRTLRERAEKRAVQQPKSSIDLNSNSKIVLAK